MTEQTRAENERLRDALHLIAGERCENYTGHWRCWDDGMGRTRGGPYTSTAWCDACIAQDALDGGRRSDTVTVHDGIAYRSGKAFGTTAERASRPRT